MSQNEWVRIKQSKSFYVMVYRRLLTSIIIFQSINVLLFLGIIYLYVRMPEPNYYATSGITLPIQLTAMNTPNYSAEPLLPPDPSVTESDKVMPL
jgi:intracellular multiplication protein IcmM